MVPPPSQNGSAPPLIVESSQHFSINRLDLHICEESAQASAVQITLTEMSVDYYPARKAARSRKEFNPYTEAMMARDKWIESILQVGSDPPMNISLGSSLNAIAKKIIVWGERLK